MALTKEKQALIKQGLEDTIKFAADSSQIKLGSDALDAASKAPNRDYSRGGGFEQGDVVTFADGEDFTDSFIQEGDKSFSVIGVVTRGGRSGYIRVFPAWFTNACHPCNDKGVQDETRWLTHEGAPAEELRGTLGSIKAVLLLLQGRTIKVTKVTKKQCRVIDIEHSNRDEKIWAFKAGMRKFYTFEWVEGEQPTTEGE